MLAHVCRGRGTRYTLYCSDRRDTHCRPWENRDRTMKNFDPLRAFNEEVAATYDDSLRGDEEETVAFLATLAQGGPALELAIGTGRIGLPLAACGIQVD